MAVRPHVSMSKKVIRTEQAPAPIGPYSQAIAAQGFLFVSGQIALNPRTGELVGGTIPEETHQVMKNLEQILQKAGSSFEKVVKCTIFVKDMNHFSTVNEVYGQYFQQQPPARETVEVSRLPKDVNVEISCIAMM
ncbi:2-iminobutanoate/2-iminopropanoate deaminase [Catalinimonas alkaloidigena]|uniref:2-iminobutanoate/2-iminopropanoate deaminase n=2 Tax=Catalinimonas alkaloidigena TaxID=1075417 RepID=A0A1G9DLD9_9BACT|nr:2-iminobutanoate/2-iminopropanoate deaminase [Catalinimonas alkaloidigena]